jgi:hypothetical protein
MILAVLYAIIAGMDRVNETQILQYNGAFQKIVGLSKYPDQTAIRRFLRRLSAHHIRQLVQVHEILRKSFFDRPQKRASLVFDLDSTVLIVYGRKVEKARVGYNSKEPGRRSYHPLLCFEAGRQEFWHGSLRPGNAATSTGAVPFLKVCLAKIPRPMARSRIRFRLDSGFYGRRVIEFLDSTGCGYAMVAKEYPSIKARARTVRFTEERRGWEVGEFRWRPLSWGKAHRFVVVRRPIPEDPVEARQLTLLKDTKCACHVFVTNLRVSPWRVYGFYSPRATVEKHIRELVCDYPLAKIPTQDWIPNVAFFQLLLLGFDLVHYFKRLCLPRSYYTKTLKTIRMELLVLPGRLIKAQKRYHLRLPRQYHFEQVFRNALSRVEKLRELPVE